MCEDTGISYEEPSPNSFHLIRLMVPARFVKDLGTMFHVNMEAVIPDWDISINEGGIAPLGGEREAYIFRQVQEIAKKNKISLKTIKGTAKRSLNILLYGNEEGNEEEIAQMGIG